MRSRVVVAVGGAAKVGCAPKKIVAAVIEAIEPASNLRTENFFVLFTSCTTYLIKRHLVCRRNEICQNKVNENLNATNKKCAVM
jgi:hypothetical protein